MGGRDGLYSTAKPSACVHMKRKGRQRGQMQGDRQFSSRPSLVRSVTVVLLFVRDSCSKQLDSDRLAADVPDDVEHARHAQDPPIHANTLQLLTPAGMPISFTSAASAPQRSSKPPQCLRFKLRRLIGWWRTPARKTPPAPPIC